MQYIMASPKSMKTNIPKKKKGVIFRVNCDPTATCVLCGSERWQEALYVALRRGGVGLDAQDLDGEKRFSVDPLGAEGRDPFPPAPRPRGSPPHRALHLRTRGPRAPPRPPRGRGRRAPQREASPQRASAPATRARGKPSTSRPGAAAPLPAPAGWGDVLARGEGARGAAGLGGAGKPEDAGLAGRGAEAAGRPGTRGSRSRQSPRASP